MQSETRIRIAMAQANLLVGDIEGNASRVIDLAIRARDQLHAQAIIFPELTLSSYPPEDLLLRAGLYMRIERSLQTICQKISGIDVILGYPKKERGGTFNMAGLIHDGKVVAEYRKQHLPNYSVFDEKRYFKRGNQQLGQMIGHYFKVIRLRHGSKNSFKKIYVYFFFSTH